MSKHHSQELVKPAAPVAGEVTDVAIIDTFANEMFADAGAGAVENVTLADVTIPRITLLQSSSNELKRAHRKYVAGAAEGNFLNSLTFEQYDGVQGIAIIPVFYERLVKQWYNSRIVATHAADTPLMNKSHGDADGKGKWITVDGIAGPEEHELVETAEFYILHLREDNRAYRVLLSMKKTQLKVAKRFISLIKDLQVPHGKSFFNPPSFAQAYLLTSVAEQNAKQEMFNNFDVKFIKLVSTKELYAEAKAYYEEAKQGTVKVQDEGEPEAPEQQGQSSNSDNVSYEPFAPVSDIPF